MSGADMQCARQGSVCADALVFPFSCDACATSVGFDASSCSFSYTSVPRTWIALWDFNAIFQQPEEDL